MANFMTFANSNFLYVIGFFSTLVLAMCFCPLFQRLALRFNIIDHPSSTIKTHPNPTPYLGGAAIGSAFIAGFSIVYLCSNHFFPLHQPLGSIFLGGFFILMVGLVDDIIAGGLSFKVKFIAQFAVSSIVFCSGLQIDFIHPQWLAYLVTLLWITGIMNAVNIIDVMDGLAGSVSLIGALAFFIISQSAGSFYSNLLPLLLAGSILGFLPYNFSRKHKMFMGDTGSLFLGYILAVTSLSIKFNNEYANLFVPILILAIPIYDTFLVTVLRLQKGISPFRGSKDHFAFRLRKMGFTIPQVIFFAASVSLGLCLCAWLIIHGTFVNSILICVLVLLGSLLVSHWLTKVEMDK